jgi:hypothetical protein
MKISSLILWFLIFSCFNIRNINADSSLVEIFSDYNTDIVLLQNPNNTFTLMGYGGSNHGSADCVIKSKGQIKNGKLSGGLKSVNTGLVSYDIADISDTVFKAELTPDALEITSPDVSGVCGLGTVFARKYLRVTTNEKLHKKTNDFIDLLRGSKGNDDILPVLEKSLSTGSNSTAPRESPTENPTFSSALISVHSKSLDLFKKGQKSEASSAVAEFLKVHTIEDGAFTQENVAQINDLGYFLEQGGKYNEAVNLLTRVVKLFPERTVAYLNLADAYAGLQQTDKAKECYLEYIELMKYNGQEKKIPQRVFEKVK